MARWSRAIPRKCARSPISGPSRARSPRRIPTGSWSPPKPPINPNLAKLLLPLAAIVVTIALLLSRCQVEQQTISLKPVSFAEIDGWAADDHAAAFAVLLKSCRKRSVGNSACKEALALGKQVGRQQARHFFEAHYTPHRIEARPEAGLVTGYYEPELEGSRKRSGKFQVPVYGRPDDIVQVKPDLLRALYNDGHSVRRHNGEELVPYYTRAEIEAGALEGRGLELLHLDDPG